MPEYTLYHCLTMAEVDIVGQKNRPLNLCSDFLAKKLIFLIFWFWNNCLKKLYARHEKGDTVYSCIAMENYSLCLIMAVAVLIWKTVMLNVCYACWLQH